MRDVDADTPARYNADPDRLFESSGCAGKLAVFAVRCTKAGRSTFYTIAVYFGSVGIVKTRYTIPASLCADAVMFLTSAAAVRVLMG